MSKDRAFTRIQIPPHIQQPYVPCANYQSPPGTCKEQSKDQSSKLSARRSRSTNATTSHPIMTRIYDPRDPLCPRFSLSSSKVDRPIQGPVSTPATTPAPRATPPLRPPPPTRQLARTSTPIPLPYAPGSPEKLLILAEFRQRNKENRCARIPNLPLTARSN